MRVFSGSLTLKPKAFGMTWHRSPVTLADPPQPTEAAWIRSHGYGVDPYRLRWDWMESRPPESEQHFIDFSGSDLLVDYQAKHGRRVLMNLYGTPRWASSAPDEDAPFGPGTGAPPADMGTWAYYVEAMAERYVGQVDWEILNEPNLTWNFYTGRMGPLAEMVRVASQVLRRVDPTGKIVCPPLTNLGAKLGGCDYLKAMLQSDTGNGTLVRDWVDVIGAHFYTPDFDRIGWIATQIIPGVRLAMAAADCEKLSLWCTEVGQLSPDLMVMPWKDRKRAIWRIVVLSLAHSMGGAERLCWYAADDGKCGFPAPEDVGWWNDTTALLTSGPLTEVDLNEGSGTVAAVIDGKHYVE